MSWIKHRYSEENVIESDDLKDLLKECPLLIRMNDGRGYFVEKPEFIVVADYNAAVLAEDDGVNRISVLSLMNITSVVPNATATGN